MQLKNKLKTQNFSQTLLDDQSASHITQEPWYLALITDSVQPFEIGSTTYYIPLYSTLGIWKVYIPPFMQKIECAEVNHNLAENLLSNLLSNYPCGNISLAQNIEPLDLNIAKFKRTNYVLYLHKTYDELYQQYHKGHKLNIKSATKHDLTISSSKDIDSFIGLYRRYSHKAIPNKYKSSEKLLSIIKECFARDCGMILQAQKPDGTIVAACFVTTYKDRFIYHLSFANTEGRKYYAMHAILDHLIKIHSDSRKILDFEGSMIPGVAYFMKGFGASEEYYYNYVWNSAWLCKISNLMRKLKSVLRR